MRTAVYFASALLASSAAAQDFREAGAHVHGSGSLDIAIEGENIVFAFSAPAFDIVGFEHEARTEAQLEAVDRAREQLSDPLGLWGVPESAACTVASFDVSLMQSHGSHDIDDDHAHNNEHENENEHEHEHEHDADHDHAEDQEREDESRHSSVAANTELHCEQIGSLTTLEPVYFERFVNAEKLAVRIVSDSGQTMVDISRDRPSISLP